MTAKNAILLIIRQNPGIEYNALLNKIVGNYSSSNSARAALSRALKDLMAFELVEKKGNRLNITEKASLSLYSEMKNKLLLKLNKLVKGKHNYLNIDSIVECLHALIERSKNDEDLLKAAKGSSDFFVSDLNQIHENIDAQISHLTYISRVFGEQINSLKELNFNDLVMRDFNKHSVSLIVRMVQKIKSDNIVLQSTDHVFLEELAKKFDSKLKGHSLSFRKENLSKALELINLKLSENRSIIVSLYFSFFKLKINHSFVYFIAPCKKLREWFKEEDDG